MIDRLRNRFIRIATLSVAAVMLLLTVILNAANFISTDRDLRDTLTLIYENEGTIPTARRAETDGGQTPWKSRKRRKRRRSRLVPAAPLRRKLPIPPAISSCAIRTTAR